MGEDLLAVRYDDGTVGARLFTMLMQHGMWEAEADEVLLEIVKDPEHCPLAFRFDTAWAGYPAQFKRAAFHVAKTQALAWLREHKVGHLAIHNLEK